MFFVSNSFLISQRKRPKWEGFGNFAPNPSILQKLTQRYVFHRQNDNQSLSDFPYTFERGKFIRTKGEILTLDTLKERQLI